MQTLQKDAFDNLRFYNKKFSVRGLLDLAAISKKRVALEITEHQYIDLMGSFGWLLNKESVCFD